MKRIYRIFLAAAGIGFGLLWLLTQAQRTPAQTEDTWFPPVNVSQSGGTEAPSLVVDSNGIFHVIWLDTYGGFMYSRWDGETWSAPQAVDLPVEPYNAIWYFTADRRGRIHAFWIDARDDLYYAKVSADEIASSLQWTPAQLLGRAVFGFSVAVDDANNLHLAYVRGKSSDDTVAPGVYYQQFPSRAANWGQAVPIDQSPYLRTISRAEANINIATASQEDGNSTVYVVWDNRPRRQVLLARSGDTGATWDAPIHIDRPPNAFYSPYKIQVAANDNQALILWKLSESGGICTQKYISSSDAGETWSESRVLFGEQTGCPRENHLFPQENDFILFSILNEQAYFLAWDGSDWSPPQPQPGFSNLIDPETNAFIDLRCLQPDLQGNVFYVVGCDPDTSGDIWLTGREIRDVQAWFPQSSEWTAPEEIASEPRAIERTYLVADSSGRLHAFWNQVTNDFVPLTTVVYYSVWDKENWAPESVIFVEPRMSAEMYSVGINSQDVIYAVWKRSNSSDLILSWADADQAYNRADWVSSAPLPVLQEHAASPDITLLENDSILLAYAVPLNEDRGIYTIFSRDGGDTWSGVKRVVDASEKGWVMVDQPQVSAYKSHLEIIWTVYDSPPEILPVAIYSAHSDDGGDTWAPSRGVDEALILWKQVLTPSENEYHRLWLESAEGVQYLWHQRSTDHGKTWGVPENLLATNDQIAGITAVIDPARQIHLLYTTQDGSQSAMLNHWRWQNGQWAASESLNLGRDQTIQSDSLSAAITEDGAIGIIYVSVRADESNQAVEYRLNFVSRHIDLPQPEMATPPLATRTPTPPPATPTPLPTSQTSLTGTPASPAPTEGALPPVPETRSGLGTGGMIAFGLLLIAAATGLFLRYRKNR